MMKQMSEKFFDRIKILYVAYIKSVVTIDISKAFGKVWHKALLAILPATALLLPSVNSF